VEELVEKRLGEEEKGERRFLRVSKILKNSIPIRFNSSANNTTHHTHHLDKIKEKESIRILTTYISKKKTNNQK